MHTSILARSAVAVATLAVGSVALAAVPATAATPSGITRETVLTAVNGIRAAQLSDTSLSDAAQLAVYDLISRACNYSLTNEDNDIHGWDATVVTPGSADGAVFTAFLHEQPAGADDYTHRICNFGVLAATDGSASLTGDATITLTTQDVPTELSTRSAAAAQSSSSKLSGDVAVTADLGQSDEQQIGLGTATLTASGEAVKTLGEVVTKKIWDNKSRAEKALAKDKYDQRIARAKKTYKKAVSRANGNSVKKAAAKKAYVAKRAAYKRKYDLAVWSYRYVKEDGRTTARAAFNVTASVQSGFLD